MNGAPLSLFRSCSCMGAVKRGPVSARYLRKARQASKQSVSQSSSFSSDGFYSCELLATLYHLHLFSTPFRLLFSSGPISTRPVFTFNFIDDIHFCEGQGLFYHVHFRAAGSRVLKREYVHSTAFTSISTFTANTSRRGAIGESSEWLLSIETEVLLNTDWCWS